MAVLSRSAGIREQNEARAQVHAQSRAAASSRRHFMFLRFASKAIWLAICTIAAPSSTPAIRAEPVSEYQVKALFLYNFAKFVEWPPGTFSSPRDPITLCIFGEDPFGGELDKAVNGKTVNNRELSIVRIARAPGAKSCQIAFIGSSDKRQASTFINSLSSAGALTVGDASGFTRWGGIIKFAMEDNMVRIEINIIAAERARLKISARLLKVAKVVVQ